VRALARRIVAQGGALLAIDYGYEGPALGETLQAVRGHGYANPFDAPGEQDLTAHVDFATLAAAARIEGAVPHGTVSQRDLLGALGIDARATALAAGAPDRAEAILADRNRLVGSDAMGHLFRALALTAPDWPIPAGFA
jgi:NADH dehydrogenase [ubiquinone] 1 alpha subcomplex assembly factor 7